MRRLVALAAAAVLLLAGCGADDPEPASPGAATTGQTTTQSGYYDR